MKALPHQALPLKEKPARNNINNSNNYSAWNSHRAVYYFVDMKEYKPKRVMMYWFVKYGFLFIFASFLCLAQSFIQHIITA